MSSLQSRKLKKQLVKYFETDDFQSLMLLLNSGTSDEREKLVTSLGEFIDAIDRSFEQDAKKLEIATHSLEISSEELRTQHKEVKKARRQIEHMLDSMDEGFFLIDSKGCVTNVVSKRAIEMLGYSPVGKEIWSCLGVGDDVESIKSVKDWYLYLFEASDPTQLFELAPEYLVGVDPTRKIQLRFQPIFDASSKLESVLLIATDITERLASELEQKRLRQMSDMIISRYQNPADFFRALQLFRELVASYKESEALKQEEALRSLHTLKGVVALFRLDTLTEAVHSAETEAKSWSGSARLEIANKLEQSFSQFENEFNDLLKLSKGSDHSKLVSINVIRDFYQSISQTDSAAKFYDSFICDPLETLLEPLKLKANVSAERLGKRVKVRINASADKFEGCKVASLVDVLGHIVSNAVDHGIEDGYERSLVGKAEYGTVDISAKVERDDLVVSISDDGRGIDFEALESKYAQKNQGKRDLSGADLIFVSGLSTKEATSMISGRGVGMSAVKEMVENLGGRIKVTSQKNLGSTFSVSVPVSVLRTQALRQAG